MHRSMALVLLVAGSSGCTRIEEPPGRALSTAAPVTPRAATTPRPSASSARQPARCVIPDLESAPAEQRPARQCPRDPGPPSRPFASGRVRFPDAPSAPTLQVELAQTEEQHARGLMYRTELAAGAGMLFSWSDERVRSFWMHDTCVPLDMLFIARDGTIAGILEQVPVLNDAPRSIPCPAAHVLEVPAGWSRQAGVRAGQRLELLP